MKKILCSLGLILITHVLTAQVLIALVFGDKLHSDKMGFGLTVSPSFCTLSETHSTERVGLGLGLYFDFKITDNFFIHPELLPKPAFGAGGIAPYATGSDSLDAVFKGGEVERKLRGFSFPMLVRYRIYKKLFVDAGPQVNMFLNMKDIFVNEVNDGEVTYTKIYKEGFTRFDVGMVAGLMYKIKSDKGMGIGVRYYQGLTDVLMMTGSQKNGVLQINLSIPVGMKAALERQERKEKEKSKE